MPRSCCASGRDKEQGAHHLPPVVSALGSGLEITEEGLGLARACGIPGVEIELAADCDPYDRLSPRWLGPEHYVDPPLDLLGEAIERAHPEALLIVSLVTCSPEWWDRLHPGDLVGWEDGSTSRCLTGCVKTRVPSLASTSWRQAMHRNLALLVERIEESPLARRIAGYVVRFGADGSWIHFGTAEGFLSDYGSEGTRGFREWVARRYPSAEELSQAWGRRLTFDEIGVPTPLERATVDPRGFRDPLRQRPAIDYQHFLADLTAEAITSAAAAISSACSCDRAIGARCGNFLELAGIQDGLQHSGQLGLRHVLMAGSIDFVIAPLVFAPSQTAPRACCSSAPEASIRRHGKLLFDAIEATDEHAVRSAFAYARARGHGLWIDRIPPRVPSELQASLRGHAASASFRRAQDASIALVLDDVGMAYVQRPAAQFAAMMRDQAIELARLPAPFDILLFQDLLEEAGTECRYRLFVFPNLFFADAARRDRVHAVLRRNAATALWIGGPGFVDQSAAFENIEKIVGISIRKPAGPHGAAIVLREAEREIRYGNAEMTAHWPVIVDPACEILGVYADSRLPGLGYKRQDGWLSVYSGAPCVSAPVLERLAQWPGVLGAGVLGAGASGGGALL
ncbi:MAG: beta-galactosidase [Planctomycetota bacterium]